MADLRPDGFTTYQSERKLAVSRRPGIYILYILVAECL
jgi:hypothetical protein